MVPVLNQLTMEMKISICIGKSSRNSSKMVNS